MDLSAQVFPDAEEESARPGGEPSPEIGRVVEIAGGSMRLTLDARALRALAPNGTRHWPPPGRSAAMCGSPPAISG
jgi:hypothetical protein